MPLDPSLVYFLLIAGVLAIGLWFADRQRYIFLIRVTEGVPRPGWGRVTPAFLEQVREALREHGVRGGWVGGVRQGRHIRLVFSRSLPPGCRQRLRNVWGVVGWKGGPATA